MRAINNSSGIPTSTSNQKEVSSDTTPTFVYLYDKEIDPNSVKFCKHVTKISPFQNHALTFDSAKGTISAVSELLGKHKEKSNHLLLHVHGHSVGIKGQAQSSRISCT